MVQKVPTQWPSEGGNYHTDWICAIMHAPSVLYLIINAISCNFADDIKLTKMRLLVLALSLQAIVAQLVIIADQSGTGEDDQTVKTSFSSPALHFHIGSCFRLRRVT